MMLTLGDASECEPSMKINPVDIVVVSSSTTDDDDETSYNSRGDHEFDKDEADLGFTEEVEVTHIEVESLHSTDSVSIKERDDDTEKETNYIKGEPKRKIMKKYAALKRKVTRKIKSRTTNDDKQDIEAKSNSTNDVPTPTKSNRKDTIDTKGFSTRKSSSSKSKQKLDETLKLTNQNTVKTNYTNLPPLDNHSGAFRENLHNPQKSRSLKHSTPPLTKTTQPSNSNENRKNVSQSKPPISPCSSESANGSVTTGDTCTASTLTNSGIPKDRVRSTSYFSDMLCTTALSFGYENDAVPKDSNPNVSPMSRTLSYASSSSSNNGNSEHSNQFVNPYKPYYDKADFLVDNWATASEMEKAPVYGMALLVATTVIVHPIVFFAGAATAVWAVGTFHAVEQGYEFFTDGSFSRLFWNDEEEINQKALLKNDKDSNDDVTNEASQIEPLNKPLILKEDDSRDVSLQRKSSKPTRTHVESTKEHQKPATSTPITSIATPRKTDSILTMKNLMQIHFPPLEIQVVKQVKFPGLNAKEFFDVFFSDDAPYSYKEFQKTRGDIDIVFGKWGAAKDIGFMSKLENNKDLTSLPNSDIKERTCTFKTLTKSYFGPAYGSATKTQRMTKIKNKLLVLEGRTKLSGIPFSDRFYVDERWIIESVRVSDANDETSRYISELSVFLELKFTQGCQFEAQIRKRTLSTMTEIVDAWCKQATAALVLAEKERMKREKSLVNHDRDHKPTTAEAEIPRNIPSTRRSIQSQQKNVSDEKKKLMALHENNFNALEKKIVAGNMNDIGIEVFVLDPEGSLKMNYDVKEQCPPAAIGHKHSKLAAVVNKGRMRKKFLKKIIKPNSARINQGKE